MPTRIQTAPSSAGTTKAATRRGWGSQHSLLVYTLIAYGITWTLLIAGFLGTEAGVLDPDGHPVAVMIQLAACGPLIAGLIVISLTRGRRGLADLGRRLVRWRVNPTWYAFIFLGVPLLMVAAVSILHAAEMIPGLAANWSVLFTQLPLGILSIALVTGLAEEPGWRGYAQPSANQRFRPLVATLVVSVIWAAWHLPNALFGQDMTETLTHFLATVVNGFVLAWAYNSTRGSILIVMLLHGAQNATNGLITRLLAGSAAELSNAEYYLISALTFGVLMVVVAILTRGQLGADPHRGR